MGKSVSKLQCFEQCKNKYKLTYIDKVQLEEQPHLNKGKAIHSMLEDFNNLEIVCNFINSKIGKKYYNVIKDAKKEVKIGLKIENRHLMSCDFDDPNCLFHGIADVINGNIICDYKTGKAKEYEYQDWLQLEAYAVWLFINYDYEEVHVSYLYIEHDTENEKVIKKSEVNDIVKKLLTKIKNVIDYDKSPTLEYNVTALCDYCQCNKYCQKYKEMQKRFEELR